MADYSWVQKRVSFNISDILMTIGATGFLLSSFIYFDVLDVTLQQPETYAVGFLASFAIMVVSFAFSVWTMGAKTITMYSYVEWVSLIIYILALFYPVAFPDIYTANQPWSAVIGILAGVLFWVRAVRDSS